MKSRAKIVFLILLLILPTILAVAGLKLTGGGTISGSGITGMTLVDLKDKVFTFEKSSAELDPADPTTNPIEFFTRVNGDGTETTLPEPLEGTKYYQATFVSYGRDVEYKYYFTPSRELCYFVDDSGKCFKIDEDEALAFLRSEYGMSLFEDATLPVMTLSGGDEIAPAALSWKYLIAADEYAEYSKVAEGQADTAAHTVAGAIELNFTVKPDILRVRVDKGGEEIFNDLYDNIANLSLDVGSEIGVAVEATWSESRELGYSGEATYSFRAVYQDKPVFYLSATTLSVGDFAVLTATNVGDPSTITFTSEPALNYTPIFFQDGSVYRALIPLSIRHEHPEAYKFTCGADGVNQEISVNVKPLSGGSRNFKEVIGDFKNQLPEVYSTQTAKRYFDGIFIDPVTVNTTARLGFGRTISNGKGSSFIHEGYDYAATNGGTVQAVNNGVVIYAGELADCGHLVVIDHGYGLMTTYVYMSTVTVQKGDEVKTGDKIGTCGYGDYLHLETTVFGVSVDIDPLWKAGVITD